MKIIDLHCDTLYKPVELGEDYSFFENHGHISEKKLIEADYLAQCFAVYIPSDFSGEDGYKFFKNQYKRLLKFTTESKKLSIAKNTMAILKNQNKGKISAVLTLENADLLNGDINRLKFLENCGVKILGLIHNGENCIGFPHTSPNLSLKDFGKEVVNAVNNNEMIIDVSHLNVAGFWEISKLSKKPFIASHSACNNLQNHSRNLSDEQIRAIAISGGVVGIPFYAPFLNGGIKTEMEDIILHIKHLIKVGGKEIPAFGTDFDGMECEMFLKDCSKMQILTEELIKKFRFSVTEKICFKNALRILK